MSKFINADCMDVMRQYPDDYFDLAIVDPPYFSGPEKRKYYGRKISPIGVQRLYGQTSEWEVPGTEYFEELFRVSKNQIIWGVNYFQYYFAPGRIVWDKVNGQSSFSDCEIAYCSLISEKVDVFASAWLDGYTVEKDKLYTVEIPNPNLNTHTILQKIGKGLALIMATNARWKGWESSKLTESEIKQDFDFLWQFAKPVEEN